MRFVRSGFDSAYGPQHLAGRITPPRPSLEPLLARRDRYTVLSRRSGDGLMAPRDGVMAPRDGLMHRAFRGARLTARRVLLGWQTLFMVSGAKLIKDRLG